MVKHTRTVALYSNIFTFTLSQRTKHDAAKMMWTVYVPVISHMQCKDFMYP